MNYDREVGVKVFQDILHTLSVIRSSSICNIFFAVEKMLYIFFLIWSCNLYTYLVVSTKEPLVELHLQHDIVQHAILAAHLFVMVLQIQSDSY